MPPALTGLTDRWSWRARFGILVIHKDGVPESEFWAMSPPGVTIHVARFESPRRPGTDFAEDAGSALAESPDIERGIGFFGQMALDVLCLCFSTGSFLGGTSFDQAFVARAAPRAGGSAITTTALGTLAATEAAGVRRPLVVTPPWFTDALIEAAARFLTEEGLAVAGVCRFDLGPGWRDVKPSEIYDRGGQWEVSPESLYRQVRRAFPPGADGVLVVGNGLRAIEAIQPLEDDLGCPVLTANQVCLWHCLRLAGIRASVRGYGRLFGLGVPTPRH